MAAEKSIPVSEATTGVLDGVATSAVTRSDATTGYRQEFVIGDDTTNAARAKVSNASPGNTDYALETRTLNYDSNGVAMTSFPAGFLRVTDEPHQLFYDPFDTFDTTNRWNAAVSSGGGVAAAVAAGVMTLGSGTTANGYSYIQSQATFTPTVPSWLGNSWAIQIESGATAGNNAVRFWGLGSIGGTPTTTNPLGPTGNGYGFLLDTSGVLQAVVISAGTVTNVASLAALQPTDGAYHRYICYYRTDKIYWYIDTLASTGLAAQSNFQAPQVQTLPLLQLAVAGATPPASSRVITNTGLAVWDTGKNNHSMSDGVYPWRKATIKPASTAPVAADNALVVAASPNSANPGDTLTSAVFSSGASTLVAPLNGARNASLYSDSASTFNGSITVAGSLDGGVTFPITLFFGTGALTLTPGMTGASAAQLVHVPAGVGHIKVAVSAYTSGTGTFTLRATNSGDAISSLITTAFPANSNGPQLNVRATIAGTGGGTPAVTVGNAYANIGDKALVVSTTAYSHPPIQWTDSGTLAALNANVGSYDYGRPAASVTIPSTSTFVGTLTPQVNLNGDGTTWVNTFFIDPTTGQVSKTLATSSGIPYVRSIFTPPGSYSARVIATSYVSGTTGNIYITHAPQGADVPMFQQAAGSSILTNQPVALIGVNDGSGNAAAITMKALPTGGIGLAAVPVYTNAIQLLTYTYGIRGVVTGALTANTAKPIISIDHAASATKTVRIRRIMVSGIQTTALAGLLDFQFTTGTAQASAGTVVVAGKRNQADANAECVVRGGATLPTITAATVLDVVPFGVSASAAVSTGPFTLIYDWQEAGETKPWTLRNGVLESFVINAISTAAMNWTLTFHVTLTEE